MGSLDPEDCYSYYPTYTIYVYVYIYIYIYIYIYMYTVNPRIAAQGYYFFADARPWATIQGGSLFKGAAIHFS